MIDNQVFLDPHVLEAFLKFVNPGKPEEEE
jgi:hypothetical protein